MAIFGLPNLTVPQKEKVKVGTLLAHRMADVAEICNRKGLPWILETPLIRVGHPSVLKLPRWLKIRLEPSTCHADIHQCMFAALDERPSNHIFKKASSFVSNFSLDGFVRLCNHSVRLWHHEPTGRRMYASHPPFGGTVLWQELGPDDVPTGVH